MTATIERTHRESAVRTISVTQYSRKGIAMIWAAAALPMAALSWIVAPAVAGDGPTGLVQALLICMTIGLAWQFVMVAGLVGYEQRSLRWSRLREALWLRSPRSPKTGRVGGRVWWVLVPLIVGFGGEEVIGLTAPHGRDFGEFLSSTAGKAMLHGAWGWFALIAVMVVLNTVVGEELLFRGVLLPRMQGAFGDGDWVANGVLFAIYHLHMPWAIPAALLDTFFLSWPTKRYRSAWIGIAVHSAQSVVILIGVFALVVGR